jgi:hypothetical protein
MNVRQDFQEVAAPTSKEMTEGSCAAAGNKKVPKHKTQTRCTAVGYSPSGTSRHEGLPWDKQGRHDLSVPL